MIVRKWEEGGKGQTSAAAQIPRAGMPELPSSEWRRGQWAPRWRRARVPNFLVDGNIWRYIVVKEKRPKLKLSQVGKGDDENVMDG